ncbi:alpha/beta fold hydrolase [Trueperella pecoris]|uniref:Alpha/beta fold hydrolase n=1 Tax=Trueperella pecoris TaxID=2733571 RepID=A0A7M1QZ95_9ACTO|nr:alpha/beta fold hydrolase [Trueperella pecoris]QOR47213.1 alpha/beta fold hydrolase [Trueperella pecoris]
MDLNPAARLLGNLPVVQHSLVNIDSMFVRVHRIGAPPPGLNRILIDAPGDSRVTFVLIHGIGLSSTYMLPLALELAQYGEVFVMDLPGSSGLPTPNRQLSIAGFAAVVDQAMRLNGIEDPILVGHSMGAQIVVELMARRPDHFRRACLVGPPVNAAERNLPMVLARYLESAIYEEYDLVRVAALSYVRSAQHWIMRTLPALLAYKIEDRMRLIGPSAQLIILHGEHDYLVPSTWADFLASQVNNAQCVQIAGAAHSTIYNSDDDVARAAASLMTPDERAHISHSHSYLNRLREAREGYEHAPA